MTKHLKTAAILTIAAFAGAAATATTLASPPKVPAGHACLAVGPNLCFSGSTDWVAQAAGQQLIAAQKMEMMVADAN